MPKRAMPEDTRSQREKFIDAARELGASESQAIFEHALRKVAKAPGLEVKKAAKKRKR